MRSTEGTEVDATADRIEFETMLLARHMARPRQGDRHLESSAYLLLNRLHMRRQVDMAGAQDAYAINGSYDFPIRSDTVGAVGSVVTTEARPVSSTSTAGTGSGWARRG